MLFILACCVVLGAIGGLVVADYPLIGTILIVLGALGSLISLVSSFFQQWKVERISFVQDIILFQYGRGNYYKEIYFKNLADNKSSDRAIQLLEKALVVDPSDSEVMEHLAAQLAVNLNLIRWLHNEKTDKYFDEIQKIKKLCIKAKKKHASTSLFYVVVGIIWDFEGKHEQARKMFKMAGAKCHDRFWRLYMAASWHMSGKHEEALFEMQRTINEGINHWLVDFYLGRAYYAVGEYKKAIKIVKSVYKAHKNNPFVSAVLMKSYWENGEILKSADLNFIMAIKGVRYSAKFAIRNLVSAIKKYIIGLLIYSSRLGWMVTKHIPFLRQVHIKMNNPSQPYRTMGRVFFMGGDYWKAVDHFSRAASIVTCDGEIYNRLGVALAHVGDRAGAINNLKKAIVLDPKNQGYQWNLGQVDLWVSGLRGKVVNQKDTQPIV